MSDFKRRVNKKFNELADEKFAYGKCDCFTFTLSMVLEWHGDEYNFVSLLHPYRNKREALEYMRAHGGIEALTTGTLGYSIDPCKCVDGDVVTAEVSVGGEDLVALGFVMSGRGWFKTRTRVLDVPLNLCRKGWRL